MRVQVRLSSASPLDSPPLFIEGDRQPEFPYQAYRRISRLARMVVDIAATILRRRPRWWVLYTSMALVAVLALQARQAHLSGGELVIVKIAFATLAGGIVWLWAWEYRRELF